MQEIARRIGLDWNYESPSEIFDEMVPLMPDYANLNYDNLGVGLPEPSAQPRETRSEEQ